MIKVEALLHSTGNILVILQSKYGLALGNMLLLCLQPTPFQGSC